jgi:hypothetical protein
MMRYTKILFLSMVVVGLMAFQAGALTNITVVNRGIAIEKISTVTGFTDERGIGAPVAVRVDGAAGLVATDQVSFSLTGGATFNNAAAMKICSGGVGLAIGGNDDIDLSVAGATLTVGGGGASLTFTLNAAVPVNQVLYVARQCNTALATLYLGPQIVIPAGLAAPAVIRENTTTTDALEAPAAGSSIIYTAFQQFTTSFAANFRVIDVNKDLLKFDGATALELQSRTMVFRTIFNNAAVGDIQAINIANAQVSISLTGDMTGVTSIKLVNAGTTTTIADFALGTGVANATIGLAAMIGVNYDILFTINSTDIKDDRAFNLSMTIAPANDIIQGTTLVNPVTPQAIGAVAGVAPGQRILVWATNGTQFIVAYTRSDPSLGISTAIRVENVTGAARNYWLLVNNPATGKWTMIKSKQPIAAGSTTIFTASGIMTDAAAIVTLPATGFSTRVVVDEVNNPQNVAAFATQFITGSGYRNLEVLKNAGWFD